MEKPEKKNITEPLELQNKIADTLSGKIPVDFTFPYFSPDYELPFIHIGTEKQLFVDNYIIDHLYGVERVFPAPEKSEKPILKASNFPWETCKCNNIIPAAALYDAEEKIFKMWYTVSVSGDCLGTGQILCYAESSDCINWNKPLSNKCLPYEDCTETNIVCYDTSAVTVVQNYDKSNLAQKYFLIYDPYSEAHKKGRYTMTRVASSPDGIQWTTICEDSPFPHQHESRIIWDESIRKWIGYSQYSHHWHNGPRVRQIGRQESPDLINWSNKEVVISPIWEPALPPSMEYGAMSPRKEGSLYIGIVDEYNMEPLWCVSDKGVNSRDQTHIEFALYCSRDGKRWQRAVPDTWADNGEWGNIDCGISAFTIAGQLTYNGKMYIPYCAVPCKQWASWSPAGKTVVPEDAKLESIRHYENLKESGSDPFSFMPLRSVGALILREDGWAKLTPQYESGEAITKQFVFEGNQLLINAECNLGNIKVEILDPYFKPYEGFSVEDCNYITGSDVWHTVSWKENSDVSSLWNKPCRLKFHIRQSDLYAFKFDYV